MDSNKKRAPRNQTINLSEKEFLVYKQKLKKLEISVSLADIQDSVIHQDLYEALPYLPKTAFDLLILDPPYNLSRTFGEQHFNQRSDEDYQAWVRSWLEALIPCLKPDATIYVCGDWRSSGALYTILKDYFIIQNRITWEREKGRGAKRNWKNSSEDIWFCTLSQNYIFNVEAVKLKRRVIAPYRTAEGDPKDWEVTAEGNYRITHPSNLWTDISVPFWSMPENTDHPTQKPEKLLAKLILASSKPGDVILDPFLGSGSTAVTAKKLDRHYVGIEIDETYCCLAEKRLALAEQDRSIQGYVEGVFWERNSSQERQKASPLKQNSGTLPLFGDDSNSKGIRGNDHA